MLTLPNSWLTTVLSVLAVLTAFLIALDQVSVHWALPLDRRLGRFMARNRTKEETRLMRLASTFGGPYGILAVMAVGQVALFLTGHVEYGAIFLFTVVAAIGYALAVKLLTARRRPSHGLEKQRTYAFPSAHTLASTVLYLSLGFVATQSMDVSSGAILMGFICLLAFAIGSSRVYLGVHYPSDVLAGYVAGGTWVWIFLYLIQGK